MINPFNKPIPGMSLTSKPKGRAYERPPAITDPDDAIQMHLTRLGEEDKLVPLLQAVDLEPETFDIKTLTTGILRSAVMQGIHSVDVSMIIAPVLHELIKVSLEEAGLDYEEGFIDKKKEEQRQRDVEFAFAMKEARELGEAPEPSPEVPEEPPVEDTGGLFQRREVE